jgi:hypothetical protein
VCLLTDESFPVCEYKTSAENTGFLKLLNNVRKEENIMKKMRGFVDPFTLGFIVVLGGAVAGMTLSKDVVDEGQMAQESKSQTELTAPAQEEPKT